jgi:hypothetical protein
MWREAMKPGQGSRTDLVDNVTQVGKPKGNSRSYAVSRLQREAPDLFAKVAAGEMSANAAAIEAGFRKRKTPLDHLRAAWRKANPWATSCNSMRRDMTTSLRACLAAEAWKKLFPEGAPNAGKFGSHGKSKTGPTLDFETFAHQTFKVGKTYAKQALAIANHSAELLEMAKLLVEIRPHEVLEVGHRLNVGRDGHGDKKPIAPIQGGQAIKQESPSMTRRHSFAVR